MISWFQQAVDAEPTTGIWIAAIAGLSALLVALVTLAQNVMLARRNKGDHGAVEVALQSLADGQRHLGGRVEDTYHLARHASESHKIVRRSLDGIHSELHDHVEWEASQKYMTPNEIHAAIRQALEK